MRIQKLIEQIMAYPEHIKMEFYITPWKGEAFRAASFDNREDAIVFLFDKDIHNWEVGYFSIDEMDYPKCTHLGMAIRLSKAA